MAKVTNGAVTGNKPMRAIISGIKPRLVGGTLFVSLPPELRRDIDGGCQCSYCVAHPSKVAQWDTLAIDAKAQRNTWTVHYPELDAWR